jgi:nitroreductase
MAAGAAANRELLDLLRSVRSVRAFLPDAIPRAVLRQVVEAATWAPSARNAQPWYFVVVCDDARKQAVGALYLRAWRQARAFTESADADRDVRDRPGYAAMMRAVDRLAEAIGHAPALVLAGLDTQQLGPMADAQGHILAPQSAYASIFPAVQNLLIAARAFGLGSTLTTVAGLVEGEIRALLGIPATVHIAALVPLGYPRRPFAPVQRKPVESVAFLDAWGNPLKG